MYIVYCCLEPVPKLEAEKTKLYHTNIIPKLNLIIPKLNL